ncbi:unnamed protein product [Oikopleura dioica]|uniref:Peptidase S1 domain-containing protein n=1 Tax=Oikopleura dioica TaxID=34765 RepID=E4WT02_OIKDI|nr:unnamed protein product [Oikopleura dioica]
MTNFGDTSGICMHAEVMDPAFVWDQNNQKMSCVKNGQKTLLPCAQSTCDFAVANCVNDADETGYTCICKDEFPGSIVNTGDIDISTHDWINIPLVLPDCEINHNNDSVIEDWETVLSEWMTAGNNWLNFLNSATRDQVCSLVREGTIPMAARSVIPSTYGVRCNKVVDGCSREENYPSSATLSGRRNRWNNNWKGKWNKNRLIEQDDAKIVGGVVAEENQWPWITRLSLRDADGNAYLCGGTVIDNNWVLTAAHCCDGIQDIFVTFGDLSSTSFESNQYTLQAHHFEIQPEYSGVGFDLCLVHFAEDIIAEDTDGEVEMACITETLPSHGSACWVAGWGTTSSGGSTSPNLLQAGVNIMNQDYCLNKGFYSSLQSDDICAGIPDLDLNGVIDGGVDSCQGDSGGPLICNVDGKATLVGAVSRGIGCAAEVKS